MNKKQVSMVTFALVLANVMAGLDSTIVNTAIPAIIADLHGIQFIGWIIALMLLGMSVSTPIWSKLGEKIGDKLTFEISILLFALGSLFQGLAHDMIQFLIARTIMGIGAGGMGSIPYIIVGYVFKNIKKRTKVLGYIGASFSVASIAGPLVGGYLVDSFSWHWVFYVNVPIGLLTIFLTAIYYQEDREFKKSRFDLVGSILISLGLIIFLSGIQLLDMVNGLVCLGLIVLGLLILFGFIKYEQRAANPIIAIDMFKNKALMVDLWLFVLTWGAFIAVNTYLPMWAQGLLASSALMGGISLVPNSLADTIGTQVVNSLTAKMGEYRLILLCIICMMISIVGMVFVPVEANFALIAFIATFSGFGVGALFVLLQVKVQVDAGQEQMAQATSLSFLIRMISQTVMAAVYGVIMNMALGHGVKNSGGKISLSMMNKLSDVEAAKSLPKDLLPQMRVIFHQGLREIMICASILLVISLVVNYLANGKEKAKAEI